MADVSKEPRQSGTRVSRPGGVLVAFFVCITYHHFSVTFMLCCFLSYFVTFFSFSCFVFAQICSYLELRFTKSTVVFVVPTELMTGRFAHRWLQHRDSFEELLLTSNGTLNFSPADASRPSIALLKTLPAAPLVRAWGVYAMIMEREGAKPLMYVGSATNNEAILHTRQNEYNAERVGNGDTSLPAMYFPMRHKFYRRTHWGMLPRGAANLKVGRDSRAREGPQSRVCCTVMCIQFE